MKAPWVINAPFGSTESLSEYSDARAKQNKAPELSQLLTASVNDITDVNGNPQKMLSFNAGTDDDFIHSYRLQFLDENKNVIEFYETDYDGKPVSNDKNGGKIAISELLYFSDFVLGLENMSETVELRLPASMPENAEYVAITAIDSWGAESNTAVCKL